MTPQDITPGQAPSADGSGATPSDTTLTRSQRLDRLPFGRKHLKLLTSSGIGWALDAMDVGLVSFVIAALAVYWDLTPTDKSLIISLGFVGMTLGAGLGGILADRLGRRTVFAISLLVFGIATGFSALAGSLVALLVLRFIAGFGLGAELPVTSTYVSEFAPPRIRGRVIVLLEAFWALGWIVAALVGYFVIPLSENGWRWALAIGALPAIYATMVRFGMPESVRFLERRGRHTEAEAVVREFEASAGVVAPSGSTSANTAAAAPKTKVTNAKSTVSELLAPAHRRNTAGLWLVWFCVNFAYYGAFTWIPSILFDAGFDLVKSFEFTLIITLAQLPGYLVAAWLIEVWGRRATLSVFLVGSAASAVLFGTATSAAAIIGFGMALSFFNLGSWGALYAITPELYPTKVRGTGSGWAAGVGRIASIIVPLLVPFMLAAGGKLLLFVVFSIAFAIAAVSALLLSELRGRALD